MQTELQGVVTPEQTERRVHNCQELLALHSKDQTDSLPD